MGSQPTPLTYPFRNKGLVRPDSGKPTANKPLVRPHFWEGGTLGRGKLTCHKDCIYHIYQPLKCCNSYVKAGGRSTFFLVQILTVDGQDHGPS